MKTPIAVTLIILGALLVMTPAISDMFYQRSVVEIMTRAGVTSVSLTGQMSEIYRLGCWLTGSGMVVVAILCSLSARGRSAQDERVASQASV